MIKSFKTKLLLWTGLLFALILIVIGSLVYFTLDEYLYSRVDNRLSAECRELSKVVRFRDGAIALSDSSEWTEVEHAEVGQHAIYLRISTTEGHFLGASKNEEHLTFDIPYMPLAAGELRLTTQKLDSLLFRRADLHVPASARSEAVIITSLMHIGEMDEFLTFIRRAFFLLTPLFILLGLVGIHFLSQRVFRPIARITETAQLMLSSGELGHNIASDNTDEEIRQLIDTLNSLFSKLKRTTEQIRAFSANASHELRTPLTVIRGHVEVALSRERTVEEYKQALELILNESQSMTRIIENLLQLARMDRRKQDLQMELLHLDRLLLSLKGELEKKGREADIALSFAVDIRAEIAGNRDALKLLIFNLVENAIKYNKKGGRVHVSLSQYDSGYKLSVEDTGIGINKEDLQSIFERFYRVESSRSRQAGGSGLGLSIVQWIAAEHKAEIKVDSVPDEGTRIDVIFPVVEYE